MATDELGEVIIGSAIQIHRRFGPGLLESTYKTCLAYKLRKSGLQILVEPFVSIVYEELTIERAFRPDLIVENKIVLELKHKSKKRRLSPKSPDAPTAPKPSFSRSQRSPRV